MGSRAEDSYQLTVETYNSTSWASLKQRLAGSEAHVVLAQEVHLLGIDIEYASQWARVRGWKSIIEEAIPGRVPPFSPGGVAMIREGLARPVAMASACGAQAAGQAGGWHPGSPRVWRGHACVGIHDFGSES